MMLLESGTCSVSQCWWAYFLWFSVETTLGTWWFWAGKGPGSGLSFLGTLPVTEDTL